MMTKVTARAPVSVGGHVLRSSFFLSFHMSCNQAVNILPQVRRFFTTRAKIILNVGVLENIEAVSTRQIFCLLRTVSEIWTFLPYTCSNINYGIQLCQVLWRCFVFYWPSSCPGIYSCPMYLSIYIFKQAPWLLVRQAANLLPHPNVISRTGTKNCPTLTIYWWQRTLFSRDGTKFPKISLIAPRTRCRVTCLARLSMFSRSMVMDTLVDTAVAG